MIDKTIIHIENSINVTFDIIVPFDKLQLCYLETRIGEQFACYQIARDQLNTLHEQLGKVL